MFRKVCGAAVFGFCTIMAALQPIQSQAYGGPCCDPCDSCSDRLWFNAEYLYWKIQDSPAVVPLVISGPVVPNGAPTFGQPGTTVVLGNEKINIDWRSGGRFALGYWFDDCECFGAELNYFFLPTKTKKQCVIGDGLAGSPLLTIPFINAVTVQESSTTLSSPGFFKGTAISGKTKYHKRKSSK